MVLWRPVPGALGGALYVGFLVCPCDIALPLKIIGVLCNCPNQKGGLQKLSALFDREKRQSIRIGRKQTDLAGFEKNVISAKRGVKLEKKPFLKSQKIGNPA